MSMVNLKSLVSRLDDTCRRTLEAAAGLCLSRTNYNVEVEHWLLKLIEVPNSDLSAIFHYYGVNTSRLTADLTRVLDRFKTGNSRPPALSPDIVALVRTGWLIGSIEFGAGKVRSGHLLCAILSDEPLARQATAASEEFRKIPVDTLKADFAGLCGDTCEAAETASAPIQTAGGSAPAGGAGQASEGVAGNPQTPSLNQYTIDLTARAKAGKIDPVLGRSSEIRQIVDILTRRRQNNPILTGEAGVGKTAVVEGFALRVAAGDVPPPLQNVAVRTLDLALLQAGAGMKGEFENRLKSVIEEVNKSPQPIILFIDEAHTMIGAGGQAGQGDAANLLKPALARGELRTIAATTWDEYKKYFEKDAALARRFQVVKVEEPDEQTAIEMMRGMVATLEGHH
ncbi:MAG: AAA family ATPase, partial [Planctomycetaceae bacterium]|nr:AAA family ATPase [Planctomycetaceae bacterium]